MKVFKGITPHIGQKLLRDNIYKVDAEISDNKDKRCHFFIINASRQFGKSTLLENLLLKYSIENSNNKILWLSPTNSQSKKIYREIVNAIFHTGIIQDTNQSDLRMILANGSEILFKSAEQGDNLRGLSINYMFVDEFSFIKQTIWQEILLPMLSVKGRKCFISSTPKGKNLFHNLYQLGQSTEYTNYHSWTVNYLQNPLADVNDINNLRNILPDNIFKQEYLAEFIADGGSVFNKISQCETHNQWQEPIAGMQYYAGIDLAKQNDYTVLTILDKNKNVVFIYRDNKQDWQVLTDQLYYHLNRYKPKTIIEVNSIGDVIYDLLKKRYNNIQPEFTHSSNKQNLIETLMFELNSVNIFIPTKKLFPELITELEIFEYEYNIKSRFVKYSAPKGFHDDTVMSLAYALKALNTLKSSGTYNVGAMNNHFNKSGQ